MKQRHRDRSKPKFAVGAKSHKLQSLGIRLAVDQNEIGPDMAVPMVAPFPLQGVIEMSAR